MYQRYTKRKKRIITTEDSDECCTMTWLMPHVDTSDILCIHVSPDLPTLLELKGVAAKLPYNKAQQSSRLMLM